MKNSLLLCCVIMFVMGAIFIVKGNKEHEEYINTEKVKVTATVTDVDRKVEYYRDDGKRRKEIVYYVTRKWEYNGKSYSNIKSSSYSSTVGETFEIEVSIENPNIILSNGESNMKYGSLMCCSSGVVAFIIIVLNLLLKVKIKRESKKCTN